MYKYVVLCFLLCSCLANEPVMMPLPETTSGFNINHFVHKYIWEFVGLVLLAVYGMFFYVGRKKNIRIVDNWLKEYRFLLERQFTAVGISGNFNMFMRESFDQFRLFCSGRRNCKGMLFDFKLKKRQDLFSLLLDFITPVDDIMTVDIPLDSETMKPFVFALCRKRDCKNVHSENPDLKDLGHPVAMQYTPDLTKVSGSWSVISDNNEVPAELVSGSVTNVLKVSNCFLRLIHVSDHMPTPTDNRLLLSECCIRIKVKLPNFDRMDTIEDIMKMIFDMIDSVANVHLSPKTVQSIAKSRNILSEKQQRLEHDKRQERMQIMKEQKMKEQKERAEKLSPEAQAKYEEKLEKEEKKKKLKKRMRVVKG